MEKLIEKQLREWKKLRPNEAYAERSLFKILQSPQAVSGFSLSSLFRYKAAAGILAIFIVAVISVASTGTGSNSSANLASLENESLETEIDTVDFQIQLSEANYYSDSAERVAFALDEVATD